MQAEGVSAATQIDLVLLMSYRTYLNETIPFLVTLVAYQVLFFRTTSKKT